MKTIADLHTHTLASQHAYSTLDELSMAANERGFCALAVTDHGPGMPDGAIAHHFHCLTGLPAFINGLRLYKGAEVNIMNFSGELDLENSLLERLDFVIASYHSECITPGTIEQNTQGLLASIRNPNIDCLGHCGNPVFPINAAAVIDMCARFKKIVEINSSSFRVRPGSTAICRKIAGLCMEKQVPVMVNSDAHSKWQIGDHQEALDMLSEIHFPEHLIINTSKQRLTEYFSAKKQ